MTEFYYGLPQKTWDNLCCKAEDLLYERKLGQHIVGLYPAGNRIFGDKSSPPELMCLYMDSVEPLIDPFSNYHDKDMVKCISFGKNSNSIIFVDFFKWVTWMIELSMYSVPVCWRRKKLIHAIPFGRHIIHEDNSITSIIETIAEVSIKGTYSANFQYVYNKEMLFLRAEAIIASKKVFMPCINKEWDEKLTLENEDLYMYNVHKLRSFYEEIIKSNQPIESPDEEKIKIIRKMVMDLYRYQM